MNKIYVDDLHVGDMIAFDGSQDEFQTVVAMDWNAGIIVTRWEKAFGVYELPMHDLNFDGVHRVWESRKSRRLRKDGAKWQP